MKVNRAYVGVRCNQATDESILDIYLLDEIGGKFVAERFVNTLIHKSMEISDHNR
ncbi:MAG TPA: hypothetical protein VKA87_04740 [Nitrososphaeraceae archaeon]|nr:hypothetical protein [Nitrososphaeraceae archaeon]